MQKVDLKVPAGVNFPDGLALFYDPSSSGGRMQLGFVDATGNCATPILELAADGVNWIISPRNWADGPVKKDAGGWPIISGYTKNP